MRVNHAGIVSLESPPVVRNHRPLASYDSPVLRDERPPKYTKYVNNSNEDEEAPTPTSHTTYHSSTWDGSPTKQEEYVPPSKSCLDSSLCANKWDDTSESSTFVQSRRCKLWGFCIFAVLLLILISCIPVVLILMPSVPGLGRKNDPEQLIIVETLAPTPKVSSSPTVAPSKVPSSAPSSKPSMLPSMQPSRVPTATPSNIPTLSPSIMPSALPSAAPVTSAPSSTPSTLSPTSAPSASPSGAPSTAEPTPSPTIDQLGALADFLGVSQADFFNDPDSPQYRAMEWMLLDQDVTNLDDSTIQRYALATLDFALGGFGSPTGSAQRSGFIFGAWSRPNQAECFWKGVTCNDSKQVVEISWSGMELSGSIPSEIRLLSNLTSFDMSNNALYGNLPDALYDLANLESLYLYKNQITGSISTRIGYLERLINFNLGQNELTGPIPEEFKSRSEIRPLRYLVLNRNKLSGKIPENMRLRQLFYLDLSYNQLTGTLPADLGDKFVRLRHLHLDHNQFVGSIPDTYPTAGSGRLEQWTFDNNKLVGEIPANFQFFDKLVAMTAHNNDFNVDLDKNICKLSVHHSGEMVEFKSDCDICTCGGFFCDRCP